MQGFASNSLSTVTVIVSFMAMVVLFSLARVMVCQGNEGQQETAS